MTAVERYEPTGIRAVDVAAYALANSSWVPDSYRESKGGKVREGDVIAACLLCADLDLKPMMAFRYMFVVSGAVQIAAEGQRALCARAGYDLEVVSESPLASTVRIRYRGGEWKPPVTYTIEQAKTASLLGKDNWKNYPMHMLTARACTHCISLYASEVKAGIERAGVELDAVELAALEEITGPGEAPGEVSAPGPVFAPDGATIPKEHREPGIDDAARAALLTELTTLSLADPDAFAVVRDGWKQLTGTETMPAGVNLKTGQVTRLHGWALSRMIADAAPAAEPERAAGGGGEVIDVDHPEPTDEAIPGAVHDDDPAANGWDPEDPERPF